MDSKETGVGKGEQATSPRKRYHHGDLRQALLLAGEAELAEKGVEGFTLRGCAKRAGVSHAAPAHHFKDATALLTALAAEGYRRFIAVMRARCAEAPNDAHAQLVATGRGYVDFALTNPGLFRLMFSSDRPDMSDPELRSAAEESFEILVNAVARLRGRAPGDARSTIDVAAAWSMVHGIASLLLSGHLSFLTELPPAQKERVLWEMIARSIPA